MNKKGLGGLIILGGIALIGFVWFRRNKPSIADKQLQDLKNQSNNLATSADTIDKPFEYSQQVVQNQGGNPYVSSTLSQEEQAQINQAVTENVDCGLGLAWSTGTDCTQYNIQQQQMANPNNVATSDCNPPKLIITNVKRFNATYPLPSGSGSLWNVFFKLCGANITELLPVYYKIAVVDSIGYQEIVVEKQYFFLFDNFGGNLPRRPKDAVVTLTIKTNDGKSYVETFNYKE
jgi:hypothetical protein